ncbi:MAG: hypothetical protein HOE30_11855, partial [Deltaproteobacteria bacterium]|nr:hypothetical protein [Deltaproteobacteria bacterium]
MQKTDVRLDLEQLKESIFKKFHRSTDVDLEKVGLELELFPFAANGDDRPIPADITTDNGNGTFELILKDIQQNSGPFSASDDESLLTFDSTAGGNITFEPGGQIEYSSSSRHDVRSAIIEMTENVNKISDILSKKGISLFHGAINPWYGVSEIGLKMRKPRYRAMDRYMNSVGPYGQQMMRLSASLQVNLDFGDQKTAAQRWLAANLLAPVFNALFGNSPLVGGRVTGAQSYRSITWQNLDHSRTGFPHLHRVNEKVKTPEAQYLNFALRAAVILLPDDSGVPGFRTKNFSFQQWVDSGYNGWYPDMDDWETHLTTLFPEVRPKGFMECRFIDGLPKAWWAVPAILLTSIIYNASATQQVIDLMMPDYNKLDQMLKQASISGVSTFPEKARQIFEIGLNSSSLQNEPDLGAYCERFYKH